jgi:3-oxoacyl-[acyl-carrier protein] reductase
MARLEGKVAIVTGASKGIGAAIARKLAGAGASVVVDYASAKEDADRVVAEIAAGGGKAIAVQADVSKAADVKRLFAESRRAFGALDVLVNNAGVYQFAPLDDLTESDFHRQFDVNVLGILLATREATRHFGPEGGRVINIGSVASARAMPASVVYTATKHAVDGITRVLAVELAPRRIRVNSINPGGVETEGAHRIGMIGSDMEKQVVAQTPLGRLGQPEDVARVALFLASPDSDWMTGELLLASGGFH